MGCVGLAAALVVGLGSIPAIIGIVTGFIGLRRNTENRTIAMVGLGISTFALLVSTLVIVLIGWIYSHSDDLVQNFEHVQIKNLRSFEGQPVPKLSLTASDGSTFTIPADEPQRTVVLFTYSFTSSTTFGPNYSLESGVNGLFDASGGRFRVVTFMPYDQISSEASGREHGVQSPVFGTVNAPRPFTQQDLGTMTSVYYIIDEDGVIEQVLPLETDLQTLIDAALGTSIPSSTVAPTEDAN